MQTKFIARTGIIAALYIAITWVLTPISFGVLQFRASEAMTVLPILFPEAVPGLFIGVLLANTFFGGLGLVDIIGGSLTTLVAAYLTYRYRNSLIAYLSPIILNALIVGTYLSVLTGWNYLIAIPSIAVSQAVVVFAIGYPLVNLWKKKLD